MVFNQLNAEHYFIGNQEPTPEKSDAEICALVCAVEREAAARGIVINTTYQRAIALRGGHRIERAHFQSRDGDVRGHILYRGRPVVGPAGVGERGHIDACIDVYPTPAREARNLDLHNKLREIMDSFNSSPLVRYFF